MQRSLQQDPFGLTANMLVRREGCTAQRCDAIAVFCDPTRVWDNIRQKTFDANVARHAAGWRAPGAPRRRPQALDGADRRRNPRADPGQVHAALVGLDPAGEHHERRAGCVRRPAAAAAKDRPRRSGGGRHAPRRSSRPRRRPQRLSRRAAPRRAKAAAARDRAAERADVDQAETVERFDLSSRTWVIRLPAPSVCENVFENRPGILQDEEVSTRQGLKLKLLMRLALPGLHLAWTNPRIAGTRQRADRAGQRHLLLAVVSLTELKVGPYQREEDLIASRSLNSSAGVPSRS